MKVCHSDALAAPAMQASERQRGNGSHDADGAAANPKVQASCLSGARRFGGQKQARHSKNRDSNREFRHGTLPAPPIPAETRTPDGTKSSGEEPTKAGSREIIEPPSPIIAACFFFGMKVRDRL
jgi:hypothetical protein